MNDLQKKISIIIPCYNVEKYIDRCVDSLVGQTIGIEHLECIFVDDASTDGTMRKLEIWEKQYPDNILVIACSENRKQGAARNIGIQYASADYIGFVDADDWIEPDMYEKLYSNIVLYDADVAVCNYKRDTGRQKLEMGRIPGKRDQYLKVTSAGDRKLLYHLGLGGGVWSKVYRKSLLLEHEIYFPEQILYEDNYFVAVLIQYITSIVYVEEFLYHYYVNMESTIVKRNEAYHYQDRLKIEEMILRKYIDEGWLETFYDEIEFRFIRSYFIGTLHILFTRFDSIPAELIPKMKNRVIALFPDYSNNPFLDYMGGLKPQERILLEGLTGELTAEKIPCMRKKYLSYIKEHHVYSGVVD